MHHQVRYLCNRNIEYDLGFFFIAIVCPSNCTRCIKSGSNTDCTSCAPGYYLSPGDSLTDRCIGRLQFFY